jgi:hypothetical protein
MTENEAPEKDADEQDVAELDEQQADEVEQELLDAMRSLSRKNKKIEEYLDGLARSAQKPPQEEAAPPQE